MDQKAIDQLDCMVLANVVNDTDTFTFSVSMLKLA